MIRLLAYPVQVLVDDVEFRVLRLNNRNAQVAMDANLCMGLAKKRGGRVRPGAGMALVANADGLRAIKRWYVDVQGDHPAFYGQDGEPHRTVCGAMKTFFGYVPGSERCSS